jgi:isopenicillin N synthase-like dioxygenase
VVNENKERFSFPLFFNPSFDTDVAPVPEILGQELPLYRPYSFGEFLTTRSSGNYTYQGKENIQISDFAINRD